MPTEIKNDPRRDFVRRFLPWLLAAAMLALYLCTMNHWVSLLDLGVVARLSGWIWVPDLNSPVFYLATLPMRFLPATAIPFALNLFSAGCAVLTLGLLARSVGLLPHDRTEPQLVRERNDFALLSRRSAWLPPVLAVLLCGLQLTFWEFATNGCVEMFDLLLFAVVIWQLLEYRLDGREWRLYLSSFIVGAGVAEGPSMTGFFPLFIVAIIWLRGLSFFNLSFIRRMLLCGLVGILIFLLVPLCAALFSKMPWSLLQTVKFCLASQIRVLKFYCFSISNPPAYFEDLLMPLFIALMPLLVLSIRWKIGDSSRIGSALASMTFHSIHAIFLGVCLWLAFDPPFSPREKGFGLTLYYFIALSAGYYAGYFLLIFGRKHLRAGELQPGLVKLFNLLVVASVWVLGVLAVVGLIYKNQPLVREANNEALSTYASLAVENLPRDGAIVLSDDLQQLYLAKSELARQGRNNFLLLDTTSLLYPQYHRYLHRESPQKWPLLVSAKQTESLNSMGMVGMLTMLSQSNQVYYLQPGSGYYFEQFYAEAHGLVYKLKDLPNDTLLPPFPGENLVTENESFWARAEKQLPNPDEAATSAPETAAQELLGRLHVPHEPNLNSESVGNYCSRSLDFWGVEMERAGHLTNASAAFKEALRFNPYNVVAQINGDFNQKLSSGIRPAVNVSQATADHLGMFETIHDAIVFCGPFDEPGFCFEHGRRLVDDDSFYRQAVAPLERTRQLVPDYLPARILLARIYGLSHLSDRLLDVLRAPLDEPDAFSIQPDDYTEIHVLAAAAYFQKNEMTAGTRLFNAVISQNPSNDALLITIARVYMGRNMLTNALDLANKRLSQSPDDLNWLFIKGSLDIRMEKYGDAIPLLDRVLAVQKDNSDALFQRANAYLNTGRLDEARRDYGQLQIWQTNSYQAAYGLGEAAWRQHDTNEAIRNYELYLANEPTNSIVDKTVKERLSEMKPPAGGK
jgi:tetratricopeptide (TPR) repeat protein